MVRTGTAEYFKNIQMGIVSIFDGRLVFCDDPWTDLVFISNKTRRFGGSHADRTDDSHHEVVAAKCESAN